jgi:hypothetical protein
MTTLFHEVWEWGTRVLGLQAQPPSTADRITSSAMP